MSTRFEKINRNISEIWALFKAALWEIFTENTMHMAAALSYVSLLALVPLATVVLSTFSLFPVFSGWSEQLQSFVYDNLVPASSDVVKENIDNFVGKAGRLTVVGLIFLLVTALIMLATIEDSLNKIWQVHKGRTIGQRILTYWTMITLGPLLLGAGLSLTSYGGLDSAVIKILPFAFETTAFILAYVLMPNCKVKFLHAMAGGIITSLFFQLAKKGFVLYVAKFNIYEVMYGTLAALPIFLIWIFLSWSFFLLGAQIAAGLGRLNAQNFK